MMTLVEPFRTLRWSSWLGWQIESNWANPWLFALYVVVKPITGSLVLVCMYYAATGAVRALAGRGGMVLSPEFLPYIYVSNACFGLVSIVMFGMSNVVISDRETYRMLKYIYISPAQFQTYFLGRGMARAFQGILGALLTLAAGLLIPDLRSALHPENFDAAWVLAFLAVGAAMLWAAGMLLASAVLNMSRSSSFLSEGIAGVVYFLSGVLFPLSVLPGWVQAISVSLPTTYWLEGMRRAVLGVPPPGSPWGVSPLAAWSMPELFAALLASTAGLVIAAQLFYRYSIRRAWRNGKIEETTGM